MKKILRVGCGSLIVIFLLLIFISVIGGNGGGSGGPTTSKRAGDTPTMYALGERFVLGNFAYKIEGHSSRRVIGDPSMWGAEADPGGIFVIVTFTIENVSNQSRTVLTDDFLLLDAEGRTFKTSAKATTALLRLDSQDFLVSQLQPGLPRQMHTAFLVPEGSVRGSLTVEIPEKGFARGKARVVLRE